MTLDKRASGLRLVGTNPEKNLKKPLDRQGTPPIYSASLRGASTVRSLKRRWDWRVSADFLSRRGYVGGIPKGMAGGMSFACGSGGVRPECSLKCLVSCWRAPLMRARCSSGRGFFMRSGRDKKRAKKVVDTAMAIIHIVAPLPRASKGSGGSQNRT